MCGVVGIMGTPNAARETFLGLTTLQHRGQDAAGILTYDQDGFHCVKNLGLIESVFDRDNMTTLGGSIAIGHARYSTIGRGDLGDVQPFVLSYPFGLGMIHNGNLVNVAELATELRQKGKRNLLTHSDTEVLMNVFAEALVNETAAQVAPDDDAAFWEALKRVASVVMGRTVGSYSIITLVADQGIVAFRDPSGIRPLIFGEKSGELPNGKAYGFASESVALHFNGFQITRDVRPGELIWVSPKGEMHSYIVGSETAAGKETPPKGRPCMFEWVYFASPESVLDQVPVYGSRIRLGHKLAEVIQKEIDAGTITPDIIVPVPETARIAAIALSESLRVPYREVLIKNRYIKRTFILDSQEKRQSAVRLKLSPVRSEIEGKRVLLVDDSIVRGTTSKKIIELVRQAGAKEVYFVSTCPPITHPCYYGIDFPSSEELVAYNRSIREVEKELGADRVIYQTLAGLEAAIQEGNPNVSPCMACLTGKYPTSISAATPMEEQRRRDRRSPGGPR